MRNGGNREIQNRRRYQECAVGYKIEVINVTLDPQKKKSRESHSHGLMAGKSKQRARSRSPFLPLSNMKRPKEGCSFQSKRREGATTTSSMPVIQMTS